MRQLLPLRVRRWLLVPLLFGMFVIVPPQSYCEAVDKPCWPMHSSRCIAAPAWKR
jgi:hypothetical protein